MLTSYGNMDQPFKIRCYDERFVLVLEDQQAGFNRAKRSASILKKKGFKKVIIRKTKLVDYGEPYEWQFKPAELDWTPTKFRENHLSLFPEPA